MFAFAMTRGAQFGQYERYELGSWPETQPVFDGIAFDAIVAVNCIEHIEGPITFIRWAASRLSQRGRMYLERPTPRSIEMPSADELRTFGIDVMAGNYFDDATHRDELPATAAVHDALHASGLTVEEAGIARVPFFEDHIWHIGKTKNDLVARTMAYWSFTNWCQS
jgi:cyclopropane fatty-acyl-phospholipid synthase-like methyltransferase